MCSELDTKLIIMVRQATYCEYRRVTYCEYERVLVCKNQNYSSHMSNIGVLIIIQIVYSKILNDPVHCIFAIPPKQCGEKVIF